MVGIDIVETGRVKKIYQKHGLLFLKKILVKEEIKELSLKKSHYFFKGLSCYIASKEAIFKACSEDDLDWKDISIQNITKNPLIRIKKPDFKKKIMLSFAISRDIVLSQALVAVKDLNHKEGIDNLPLRQVVDINSDE
ncbi:MAG: 4'-phosphopantetheinyl transferase superfamily protein [Candidatus Omnitrophota bacterium]|nr:4'-phosphopantetheinyl transferase superfamily protein [Candidatus Omnitrophota bacterium]